ncbi:uncharacterized protein BXZ73DRAFT_79264 [Epithele typhae]|uniref:uncharacterized protein n=1 Tax=Epithele typhae TaxID=378194 RepID=UPI0020088563|nr:uncharacterized protein BXZ73DRAFT_79264 [Epithele typhae]KAH9924292.1 hypothetical protein BXZ73DRAFT_79264 [Epithele typhae]
MLPPINPPICHIILHLPVPSPSSTSSPSPRFGCTQGIFATAPFASGIPSSLSPHIPDTALLKVPGRGRPPAQVSVLQRLRSRGRPAWVALPGERPGEQRLVPMEFADPPWLATGTNARRFAMSPEGAPALPPRPQTIGERVVTFAAASTVVPLPTIPTPVPTPTPTPRGPHPPHARGAEAGTDRDGAVAFCVLLALAMAQAVFRGQEKATWCDDLEGIRSGRWMERQRAAVRHRVRLQWWDLRQMVATLWAVIFTVLGPSLLNDPASAVMRKVSETNDFVFAWADFVFQWVSEVGQDGPSELGLHAVPSFPGIYLRFNE